MKVRIKTTKRGEKIERERKRENKREIESEEGKS